MKFATALTLVFGMSFGAYALAQTDSATTLSHPAGGGTMDTGTPTTTTDAMGGTTSGTTHRDSKKMSGKKGDHTRRKAMGGKKSGTADSMNDKDATAVGQ